MKEGAQFGRLMTAMATPFNEDGSLSVENTRKLARHLVVTGTDTIVVAGTTGESPTLTNHERDKLLDIVLDTVAGEAKVIAGTSTYDTRESVRLSKEAQNHGADGLLLVTPYYNKPSQRGLLAHFTDIADAVDLPCVLYNVPSRTNVNMRVETVLMLDEENENIVGLKEAVGTTTSDGKQQVIDIIEDKSEGFEVWSGNDQDTLWIMQSGGYGVVSVASHLVGNEINTMIGEQLHDHYNYAKDLNDNLMPLFESLFPPTSPEPSPSALKAMLKIVGLDTGRLRHPLVEVSKDYEDQTLRPLLVKHGLVNP